MRKRILALLLCLVVAIPGLGLAEKSISYLYSFVPGSLLSGEGMEKVEEFLDAVQLELTVDIRESKTLAKAVLLSEGKNALELRLRDSQDGTYGLYCSLTGENTLMCRKDQLQTFLMTVVQVLADLHILKGESLEKVSGTMSRFGKLLESATDTNLWNKLETGIDFSPYMEQLEGLVSAAEKREMDGNDPDYPGAVKETVYHLSEEDLNRIIDTALKNITAIPVLSDELNSGRLKIGKQVITESFIRDLFASMHGESTLVIYENGEGKLVNFSLQWPDISELVEDPEFSKARGIEARITREDISEERSLTVTSLNLTGMEGDLITVRMEKGPGGEVEELPTKAVHQVGEMDSAELWELIQKLGFTIARNAVNMVLDLPRVVFDLLVDKIF